MKVQDLMTKDVSCVQPGDSVMQAAQVMKSRNVGSVPVCEGKKVIGMITDRDITVNAVAAGKGADSKIDACMTREVISCKPDTDAHEAADIMARHQIRRLPVCDASGNLVGICSIGDLATVDIHINEAGDALSQISQPAGQQQLH
ncbi:CBS domain-containing protein [Alicyclobacillus ferrooxydans]|uniref:Inosine-5'-monophosphate dehydrogenase n=1 Tax=Alicyclobacillus ferrooxydans TaxID=471514 RepID=A0A0P9F0P1_9BACL|nr:CBS domain-containing protein [Alicyclobacillus ferrooxydans]KPV44908.1 inosine-5'-monophosphate dehydrogenase [Alicyclobacillus ferrooxydans]